MRDTGLGRGGGTVLAGEGSGGRLRPRRWGHGGGSPVDSQVSLSTQMSSHGPSRAEGLTEGERWVRASCRWGPSGPADTGGSHLLGRGGGLRLTLPHPPWLILRPRQVSRPRGSGCLRFNSRQVCILPGQSPVQDVCSTQPLGVPGSSALMAPPSSHPDRPRSSWGLRPGRALGPGLGVPCHFCCP